MIFAMYLFNNYKIEKRNPNAEIVSDSKFQVPSSETEHSGKTESDRENASDENSINRLTEEKNVVSYVKANKKLPPYYITKSEARNFGWVASKGNLCEVLPGKAIGGDKFSNQQKLLPVGNQYFEADVNYSCGRRNADRIVFTKNGEVYLTKNHYKTFQKQ